METGAFSKSRTGLPNPECPKGIVLAIEARKARRRLYPVSALYSAYAFAVPYVAARSGAAPGFVLAGYYLAGVVVWTGVEYVAHRFVLHGHFPDGPGLRRWLHKAFDHLHYAHHLRPWDGDHINGTIADTIPFIAPLAALSFLAPVHTAPVFLAGLLQSYILEEWVHHSVHFYSFKGRYFRYIKRHHLYHHSRKGSEVGFGLSSGFWDRFVGTRLPAEVRRSLEGRGALQGWAPESSLAVVALGEDRPPA